MSDCETSPHHYGPVRYRGRVVVDAPARRIAQVDGLTHVIDTCAYCRTVRVQTFDPDTLRRVRLRYVCPGVRPGRQP